MELIKLNKGELEKKKNELICVILLQERLKLASHSWVQLDETIQLERDKIGQN